MNSMPSLCHFPKLAKLIFYIMLEIDKCKGQVLGTWMKAMELQEWVVPQWLTLPYFNRRHWKGLLSGAMTLGIHVSFWWTNWCFIKPDHWKTFRNRTHPSIIRAVALQWNKDVVAFFIDFSTFFSLTQASANDSHITKNMAPLAFLIIAEWRQMQ